MIRFSSKAQSYLCYNLHAANAIISLNYAHVSLTVLVYNAEEQRL